MVKKWIDVPDEDTREGTMLPEILTKVQIRQRLDEAKIAKKDELVEKKLVE